MFSNKSPSKKFLHVLPVLPVYFIIFSVTFSVTFNYILDNNPLIWKLVTVPIFYSCVFMVILCHTLTMTTSPGMVELNGDKKDLNNEEIRNAMNKNNSLFCEKCNQIRPERAHHCRICDRCILKMDHHCPWVANCVGLNNQKCFYLFLFYATLGDLVAFIILLIKVLGMNMTPPIGYPKTTWELLYYNIGLITTILGAVLSCGMAFSIGVLFGMTTWELMHNRTTIEEKMQESGKQNSLQSEDYMANLKAVLGENSCTWFIPTVNVEYSIYIKNISERRSENEMRNANRANENYLSLTTNPQECEDNIQININLGD